MPLTQTQLASEVAERSGLSKSDAKAALAALEEIVLDELANAEKVRIGGVVQLVVRVKEATKPRKGRNPATGEEITISAKPASVALRARPLAKAKAALPSRVIGFRYHMYSRVRKVIVLVFGLTLLLIGIAMIVLPGPALVVIPLSLVVLGTEFLWARRCLVSLKKGAHHVKGEHQGKKR